MQQIGGKLSHFLPEFPSGYFSSWSLFLTRSSVSCWDKLIHTSSPNTHTNMHLTIRYFCLIPKPLFLARKKQKNRKVPAYLFLTFSFLSFWLNKFYICICLFVFHLQLAAFFLTLTTPHTCDYYFHPTSFFLVICSFVMIKEGAEILCDKCVLVFRVESSIEKKRRKKKSCSFRLRLPLIPIDSLKMPGMKLSSLLYVHFLWRLWISPAVRTWSITWHVTLVTGGVTSQGWRRVAGLAQNDHWRHPFY